MRIHGLPPLRAVGALLCLAAAASSAELVIRDVGLQLAILPTDFDYTVEDPTVSRSGSDGFDSGYGLTLGGLYSFTRAGDRHGFLAGVGLDVGTYAYDGGGDMATLGGSACGGYGVQLFERLDLRGLVRIGLGVADLSLPATTSTNALDATGGYLAYSAEVGLGFAITDHLVVDASAGYGLSNATLSGDDIDVTLDTSGPRFALGLAWRLTNTPWRLE